MCRARLVKNPRNTSKFTSDHIDLACPYLALVLANSLGVVRGILLIFHRSFVFLVCSGYKEPRRVRARYNRRLRVWDTQYTQGKVGAMCKACVVPLRRGRRAAPSPWCAREMELHYVLHLLQQSEIKWDSLEVLVPQAFFASAPRAGSSLGIDSDAVLA